MIVSWFSGTVPHQEVSRADTTAPIKSVRNMYDVLDTLHTDVLGALAELRVLQASLYMMCFKFKLYHWD